LEKHTLEKAFIHIECFIFLKNLTYIAFRITRGPCGPWVAHLRKRSKVTVEPFTEDHLCCPPNIGRGLLDDVIHQIWKLLALFSQTRRCLKIAFWKPNFWPCDLLMQPIRTVWTIYVADYPGIIPVEFGQILINGSKIEVVWRFPYIIQC